jgi:site-specific DNA recombinase
MKHCFGYVRVSTQKQGEGVSLDAQKDAILRFAASHDLQITEWFEEMQTAAKSGRPVFNAMIKALKSGKAAGVVMHKIDRSARNFFDWAKIGELADGGIDVHFATESLDFHSRGGRLTANIQMAVAEDYVRNLRAEILKGQRGQLERGLYPFSAPIGYRDNGARQLKTIDPIKGPMVKLAFELYATGQYSLHSLRHELAARGHRRADGEPYSKGCLEAFLQNPFYAGVIRLRHSGEVFAGLHEPLITKQTFDRVAEVRTGRTNKKVTRHQHLFRGLFSCGHCDRSMIAERQKGHIYYRCHFPSCPANCVREEMLTDKIQSTFAAASLSEEAVEAIEKKVALWSKQHVPEDAARTTNLQIGQIDLQIAKLEDAAIAGIVEPDNFHRRKEKLLLERAALNQKLLDTKKFAITPSVIQAFLERLKNIAAHYEFGTPAEKRELVEIACSNRKVQGKEVYIEPANWLVQVHEAASVLMCADARTSSRSTGELEIGKPEATDNLIEYHIDLLASLAGQVSSLGIWNRDSAQNEGNCRGGSETARLR